MNVCLIDTILDYFRLVAYAVVLLTVLRGIAHRKWTSLLFIGDLVMVLSLITTLIYAHLFGMDETLGDEIFLTVGATSWATIHFISMLKELKPIEPKVKK